MGETTAPSFYTTGGTLRPDAPSYVERQADRDLHDALVRGEYCYVLNTRQMGKSSLMVRTASRLREAGLTVAVLDLTAVGQNLTPDQWYEGLLVSLGQQLQLEDALDEFWLEHPKLGPLQRLMQALERVVLPRIPAKSRLVLFVDEIDAVRSLPFSADEFFAAVRECYNRRVQDAAFEKLAFCLLGVATPADLITETRMSPFNVGRRIRITDFSPQEADPLAAGMKGGKPVLERVLYWTSGQPYMTQRLCRAAAEAGVTRPAEVDRICAELFLSRQARESDDHLAFVRNRLLRSEADLASLLDLYQQVRGGRKVSDDETNPLCAVLKLSGVVREADGVLKVRNRIYDRVFDREWVLQHMPDAELRRQKAAYRRGVLRASAIGGAVLAAMGALVLRTGHSEQVARRARTEAEVSASRALSALKAADVARGEAERAARGEASERRRAEEAAKRAVGAHRRAETSARVARQEAQRARVAQAAAEAAALGETRQRRRAQMEARVNRRNLYVAQTLRAHQEWNAGNGWRAAEILESLRPRAGEEDLRGFEWSALRALTRDRSIYTFPEFADEVDVATVSVSPDSRLLATSDGKNTVVLWDLQSRRRVAVLKGHTDQISCATFSPDGATLVTGSRDQTLRVWDLAARRQIASHAMGGYVRAARFSPDGRILAACSWAGRAFTSVLLLDARTQARLGRIANSTAALASTNSLAFSPDGRRLAVAARNGGVGIIDVAGRRLEKILGQIPDQVWCVAVSPDGSLLAAGSWDRIIRLWDLNTLEEVGELKGHAGWVLSVAFSPDGKRLASADFDGSIHLWDIGSRSRAGTLRGHRGAVEALSFSPNGELLASASKDRTVKLWNPARAAGSAPVHWPVGARSVFVGADLRTAVVLGLDGKTRFRDLRTGGDEALDRREDQLLPLGLVHGGLTALFADRHALELWDLGTRQRTSRIRLDGVPLALSDRGTIAVATAGSSRLSVWDLRAWKKLAVLQADRLIALALAPDGRFCAVHCGNSGNGPSGIRVWHIRPSGASLIRAIPATAHRRDVAFAFTPDGGSFVSAVDGPRAAPLSSVQVTALRTGRKLLLHGHTDTIYGMAIAPNSRLLATGGMDRTIRLWDLGSGRLLTVLRGHTAPVGWLSFSPDGRSLASLGADHTMRIWKPDTGQEVGIYSLPEFTTARRWGLRFSADGKALLATDGTAAARVWHADD